MLVLTLAAVGLSLLAPWPLKIIVDYLLIDEPLPEQLEWLEFVMLMPLSSALLLLVCAMVMIFAATEATRIVKGYIERGVGDRIMYKLAADIYEHTQRLSLRYHDKHRTGDLVHRIAADAECARVMLLGVALPLLTVVVTVVLFVGVMWRLSPFLTLIAILASLPLPWLIRALEPRMSRASLQFQETEGQLMALVEQSLSAMPIVQAFDRRPAEVARFHAVAAVGLTTYMRSIVTQLQFKIGVSSLSAVGTAAILLFGALEVMQGTQTVGSLLVFLAYLASLYAPMETMAYVGSAFAQASGRARRVFEVLTPRKWSRSVRARWICASFPRVAWVRSGSSTSPWATKPGGRCCRTFRCGRDRARWSRSSAGPGPGKARSCRCCHDFSTPGRAESRSAVRTSVISLYRVCVRRSASCCRMHFFCR
jgi:ATP-binding cassette subfamily B protein/subfamily B ATP-binding cassette protein MsbA